MSLDSVTYKNYCFTVNVYKQPKQLDECLNDFRKVYPFANLIVINDGDLDYDYYDMCQKYNAVYKTGKRIKLKQYGGLWTARYLEYSLNTFDNEWIVKFDPDTVFLKPLTHNIPDQVNLFSDTNKSSSRFKVLLYGGLIGFKRSYAQYLLDKGFLLNPMYTQCKYTIPWNNEKVSFQDLILTSILNQTNMSVYKHPEIYSRYKVSPCTELPFSIYHPRNYAK